MALGHIDTMLPQPAPPSSFLHRAFFCKDEALDPLLKLTNPKQLKLTLETLNAIQLERMDPETQVAVELNRHALERCLGLNTSKTRAELKQVFSREWLRNCRPGGLEESLNYF